jgi:hypothetical protein
MRPCLTSPARRWLLALPLAAGLSAEGQITYVNLEPDAEVFADGFVSFEQWLDLDDDGTDDLRVRAIVDDIPPFEQLSVQPLAGSAVAAPGGTDGCCALLGETFAFALPAGAPIDAALNWRTAVADLSCDACGSWTPGQTAHLGVRLGGAAAPRYAWVRITPTGPASALVLDYARQDAVGVGIAAGDPGGCIPPVALAGESLDNASAALSWAAAPGALGYEVTWRLAAGGPSAVQAVTGEDATLTGLLPDTRYRWAVRGLCATDSSAFGPARFFGTSDLPRPQAVTALTANTPGFPAAEPDGLGAFGGLGRVLAPLGDLDDDGRPEFASATTFLPLGAVGGVRVLFSAGTDSLETVVNPGAGPADIRSMVALGDVDGNGAGDLALSEDLTLEVWILRLQPDGSALDAQRLLWSGAPVTGDELAAVGDVDGNGVNDLAVRQSAGAELYLLGTDGQPLARRLLDFAAAGIGGDRFEGLAGLGDVDGNGVPDLAVGNGFDDEDDGNAGAVHVVFLAPDGSIEGQVKLNGTAYPGWIDNQANDLFGRRLTGPGDLNGDGVPDLAVTATLDDDPLADAGSVLLVALNPDGTLRSSRKLADGREGLALGLSSADGLGTGLAWIGDTDGDGLGELALGAPGHDAAGTNRGIIYRLNLAVPDPCPAPLDAAVDTVAPNAVRLVWSPVAEALRYEIEGRKLGGSPKAANRLTPAFVRTGLQPGTGYAWRVRSQCAADTSAWTPLDTFVTPLPRAAAPTAARAWPNPSRGPLRVDGALGRTGEDLLLTDALGRHLGTRTVGPGGALDLTGLPAGVYRLQRGTDGVTVRILP